MSMPVDGFVRRTATLLFCDLVESTSIGESIDAEVLRLVITRYFDEMKRVLEANGGMVEKFIGDAVMGVFGIPELHEDDALRAVSAGVQMRRSVEAMNADLRTQWGVELQVRIGINTGEVVAGDPGAGHGFISGDPVNVAARLQQLAAPGEIILGPGTEELVRDATVTDYLGPIEVKGKVEPIAAFKVDEVIRGSLGHSRRLDSKLVGRERELRTLTEVWASAIGDLAPKLATVVGLPGAGKSRLAGQFISLVAGEANVLSVGFRAFGEGSALAPLASALREFCGIPEGASDEEVSSKLRSVLAVEEDPTAIIERIGSVLEVNPAPVDVQDIFWSVRKFCEAMSRTKPVVLLLDDVQWAGSAMLDLIEYLVTFTRAPLLLLALSRRDLRDELPSWGHQSAAVELGPLTPEEIGELLSNLLDGWAMPGALQKRLVEMADGNPLYVEELIRSLIDADVLRRGAGRWELHVTPSEIQIPPTIGAIVAARLEQLSETERVVLERAAVIGKNFWWRALTALVPEEMVAGLGRVFQSLMRKELIEPDLSIKGDDDSFRFKHTLVREIAYAGISKQQRAQLHEELAGWLEKTLSTDDAGNEPLAYHLEQVVLLRRSLGFPNEAVDDLGRRAAGLLETAAERALDSADAQTAVNALRRATRLQPADDPASLGLSIKLGYALTELGEFKVARQELEMASRRATREGEPRLWAQSELLCLMLDNYLMTNDDLTIDLVRLDTLEPAFEGANDEVWLGRAEYLRANLHWDGYQLGEAEAALGRALQMARKAGCAPDVARALGSFTAVLLRGPHPVDDAIERCETIISLSSDQLLVNAKCLLRLAGLHAMKDEFTFARRKIHESRAILEDLGRTFHLAASTHEAGLVELLAGDNRAAEIEFSMGIELLESMEERATLASSAAYLARALYAQGRHEEAMHWTEASEAAWGDEGSGIVEWGPTRAKILARWGHADIAEGLARSVLEPVSDSDDVLARGHALVGLAEVLAITHRPDSSRYLEEANKLYSAKGIRPLVRRILAKLVATSAA